MKKLMYLFMTVTLFNCSESPKEVESKIFTEKEVNNFIRIYPQWTKNVQTEAETTEKFKHRMINLSNEPNFLTDFPFQLTSITDTTVSGQEVKLAVFKSFKDASRSKGQLLNQLELEIRAMMSTGQANALTLNKKYTLKGMLYKQGKRADVKFFHGRETPLYTLGKYTFWNVETKPI